MDIRIFKPALITLAIFAFLSKTWSQPSNDVCETAIEITGVISDQAFVCIAGTTLDALPETTNNFCQIGEFPTVWYRISMDGATTLVNIQVTSSDFEAPTITIYRQLTGCSDIVQIPLTQSNLQCVVGSCGVAEAIGTDVESFEEYYIVIGSAYSIGGDFELCINTVSVASACVVNREIEITSRSGPGPLTGPFFPGETIGICMNVNSFTAAGNGCQWFQGIVPVFGNGWDPSSFDISGQPINATVNGNPMGLGGNGIYGASTWDWFEDVGYHHDNIFYQVGDVDGNGTVDLCNILYDPDCPDLGGIQGGCCGSCWDDPGDILPPGWFAYGIDGNCPIPGPPISVDYGDGNTCGCCMGPWNFCFELIVRDFPDCFDDCSTQDLSLGFFTFADGEVGSWNGGASLCAFDQPAKLTLPMCCLPIEDDDELLDTICSGQALGYIIDQPNVTYWQWTVDAGPVTGAHQGEGGQGSVINDTLINSGNVIETVLYTFYGFSGVCEVFTHLLHVPVSPGSPLGIMFDPLPVCGDTMPFIITANVTGGSGNYEYLWSPGGENTPSIFITNPVQGSQYIVTVTDTEGCTNSATITINLNSLPVAINAPVIAQCQQDGPITLDGTASGGIEPYNYEWTLPDGSLLTGATISAENSGLYLLEVSDSLGCIGIDSISLTFLSAPEVSIDGMISDTSICTGESLNLSASAAGGVSPYLFIWSTPLGLDTAQSISVTAEGVYEVFVIDNNGCIDSSTVLIFENALPVVDLGPDSIIVESIILDAGNPGSTYLWNTGDTTQTLTVVNPGTYFVQVTDVNGCIGSDTIYVDLSIGIIPLSESEHIKIFPNPNKGIFTLAVQLITSEELSLEITDILGKHVFTTKTESVSGTFSKEIKLDNYTPGVYYIYLKLGMKRYGGKIVVE